VPGRAAPVSHRQAAFRTATKDRVIPLGVNVVELALADRALTLTNLLKPFWPRLGLTKGDLLQYYVEVAPVLLPHLRDRAMVMKRYPNGAAGPFFFMKRAPTPRPSGPSRWSTKRSAEWEPLAPKLVVEVGYDHFTGGRFRHGTRFLRWRPDKAPRQCTFDQVKVATRSASLLPPRMVAESQTT